MKHTGVLEQFMHSKTYLHTMTNDYASDGIHIVEKAHQVFKH